MFRPIMHGHSISNEFAEQKRQVSISVDTLNLTEDESTYRAFLQIEPPEVQNIYNVIPHQSFYDIILAWDEHILESCSNARLFPFGTCWISDKSDSPKTNNVSFITSSKAHCPGHRLRQDIFNNIPNITKHRSPPRIPDKSPLLKPFRYSIVVENVKRNNWFTEKLIDCLVCKTIPIFWGCPNVGQFFDTRGFLCFDSLPQLKDILRHINDDTYNSKLEFINKNYHEALKYCNIWQRVDDIIREELS